MEKCPPIVLPPVYECYDYCVPREVPIIQPIIRVNRRIIVNYPKVYFVPETQNTVVDPGCPVPGKRC